MNITAEDSITSHVGNNQQLRDIVRGEYRVIKREACTIIVDLIWLWVLFSHTTPKCSFRT